MKQLTRRETLAALLGLPLAISGCGSSRELPPLPPGELLGTSRDVGHQIRDARQPPRPSSWEEAETLVVGGGVAGLTAARRLKMAGQEPTLLELENRVGGTSRSGKSGLVAYPWGAHYVPAPRRENKALIQLLNEIGVLEGEDEAGDPLVKEQFLCRDPQERLFYKGEWYEGLYLRSGASSEDLRQFAEFGKEMERWVNWRDAQQRPAFTLPLAYGSDDPEVTRLDQQSMSEWLDERKFTSPRLRWYVDYACRDDYGLRSQQTSAWAGIFYFASRIGNNGKSRPFITWPEGNGRLVQHLQSSLKLVRRGYAVHHIARAGANGGADDKTNTPSSAGQQSRRWEVVGKDAAGQPFGFRAKRVIFAAPHFLTPYVIPALRQRTQYLSDFHYGAWTVVNLELAAPTNDAGFPMAWDNVLYDSPSLGYVNATYQRGMDFQKQHWTYYYPVTDDDPRKARARLLEIGREGWADAALTDLSVAHSEVRQLVKRADVMRWGHAMIQPRPGFVWGSARRQANELTSDGLYFAHSDLSGVALFEEAFYQGNRAAELVLKDLGVNSPSVL